MRKQENLVLKELQLTELEILKEFRRICEKNNLKYFLIGGTLLGAIRHDGFIPWDDDIDVGMPRNDYEKFLKIIKTELNEKYYYHYYNNDKKYYLSFLKIKKKNTLFDEKFIENIKTDKGIFIDVFPFDNIFNPDSFVSRFRTSFSNILIPIICYKRGIYSKKQLPIPTLRYFFGIFPIKFLLRIKEFFAKIDNKKQMRYLATFGEMIKPRDAFEYNKIFPLKKHNFEGEKFNIPRDYDYYLTKVYGDYMKLPPKSERIAHPHGKIIFDLEKGE